MRPLYCLSYPPSYFIENLVELHKTQMCQVLYIPCVTEYKTRCQKQGNGSIMARFCIRTHLTKRVPATLRSANSGDHIMQQEFGLSSLSLSLPLSLSPQTHPLTHPHTHTLSLTHTHTLQPAMLRCAWHHLCQGNNLSNLF
jgi:hypothetical protein